MHMRVRNVAMNMSLDNHQEKNLQHRKPASAKPDFEKLFGDFTAFTMSAKGKIYKVPKKQNFVTLRYFMPSKNKIGLLL